jgi:glycosyltransferase involved in cell wall biosynthesis
MTLTIASMPAYNEEMSIANVIRGCEKYVDKVVVVDDGSIDATAQIAISLNAHVVRHPRNMGYGAALRSCFEEARKMNADRMVIIDSDGQHDSEDIPKLLEPISRGYDLVIGSRFIAKKTEKIPFYRKAGMKVLDAITNFVGETEVSDSQCGFRAYSRNAMEALKISGNGMSAGSEILLQIKENNLRIKEVAICCNYDLENTSKQDPITHGLNVIMYLMGRLKEKKPLHYFAFPGMVFIGAGFVEGLNSLKVYSQGGGLDLVAALAALATTMLILVGSGMIFMGIARHYSVSKVAAANSLQD